MADDEQPQAKEYTDSNVLKDFCNYEPQLVMDEQVTKQAEALKKLIGMHEELTFALAGLVMEHEKLKTRVATLEGLVSGDITKQRIHIPITGQTQICDHHKLDDLKVGDACELCGTRRVEGGIVYRTFKS
jgi:hypothetical protein